MNRKRPFFEEQNSVWFGNYPLTIFAEPSAEVLADLMLAFQSGTWKNSFKGKRISSRFIPSSIDKLFRLSWDGLFDVKSVGINSIAWFLEVCIGFGLELKPDYKDFVTRLLSGEMLVDRKFPHDKWYYHAMSKSFGPEN